ncbi:MAG: hypothetical protein RLZZ253_2956, partial [Verrucomicrobiota bacterium]
MIPRFFILLILCAASVLGAERPNIL